MSQTTSFVRRYYIIFINISVFIDDFYKKFIFFVMNDNDFVTFVFMVLFGNHRLTSDFETNP